MVLWLHRDTAVNHAVLLFILVRCKQLNHRHRPKQLDSPHRMETINQTSTLGLTLSLETSIYTIIACQSKYWEHHVLLYNNAALRWTFLFRHLWKLYFVIVHFLYFVCLFFNVQFNHIYSQGIVNIMLKLKKSY